MGLAPLVAATVSFFRAVGLGALGVIFLQVFDRLQTRGGSDHLLVYAGFLAVVVTVLLITEWLRLRILKQNLDPELARWFAGWTDLISGLPILAVMYLVYPGSILMGLLGFSSALFLSWSLGQTGNKARTLSALVLVVSSWLASTMASSALTLNHTTSVGGAALLSCLVAWMTWIGFVRWRRPVTDAEIF